MFITDSALTLRFIRWSRGILFYPIFWIVTSHFFLCHFLGRPFFNTLLSDPYPFVKWWDKIQYLILCYPSLFCLIFLLFYCCVIILDQRSRHSCFFKIPCIYNLCMNKYALILCWKMYKECCWIWWKVQLMQHLFYFQFIRLPFKVIN